MLKNYLKIAYRNLFRYKIFSLINVFGLAFGMASAILILLWVLDEISYDKYYANADNTYLVLRGDSDGKTAVTSKLLASALKEDYPQIEKSTNFIQLRENYSFLIQNGDKGFKESVFLAESNFFDFFSLGFEQGDAETCLAASNSIVITKDVAKKYFGTLDPIGKPLDVSGFGHKSVMNVSGIIENIPSQSHIQSQIILPSSWLASIGLNFDTWKDQSFHTYIQVKDNSDLDDLSLQIKQCEVKNYGDQNTNDLSYSLIPLDKIHLYGKDIRFLQSTGDIKYVKIFLAIALIILLIASINYMNLSTALALKRAKEVGVKKTVGASKSVLIIQFFAESLLLAFIAYIFSILLVVLFLHEFNFLTGKELVIKPFEPFFLLLSIFVVVFTGFLAGSYPALFLSSFSPVQVLKGNLKLGFGNLATRKGLVVFQFAISIVITACTLIVMNQISFIRNSNLGFDKENLLCIQMTGETNNKFDVLKNELLRNPEIVNVSRSEPVSSFLTSTTSVDWTGKSENEEKQFWILHTDCNLADVYKFEMNMGRYFSDEYPSDKTSAYVINEAAASSMGLKSPLDNEIRLWGKKGRVIGVVKNFHFASFHNAIEPLIFKIPSNDQQAGRFSIISIRFKSQKPNDLLLFFERTWQKTPAR